MNAQAPILAPLTLPDPEQREALRALLQPFFGAKALESVDVHVADQLGRLAGEGDPQVLLALAFAVRAPRHGHICVDLLALSDDRVLPEEVDRGDDPTEPRAPLPWPEDRVGWLERVARSELVDTKGDSASPRPFVLASGLLYTRRYWHYQDRLARVLTSRFREERSVPDPKLLKDGLTALFDATSGVDRQQLGAAMALQRGFCVISGGPGTGKTYTVRNVLTLLWAQTAAMQQQDPSVPDLRVALAAPTGKAAARMKEAIGVGLEAFLVRAEAALPPGCAAPDLGRFLADLQPSTLHILLRWNPANPTRFRHDEQDPVPYDVVVVDEASMVDFALMAKLALGVAPGARLILLGDRHQLASVEAGTVLADLCGPSAVDTLRLSTGFVGQLDAISGIDLSGHVKDAAGAGPWDCIVQLDRSRRFGVDSGIGTFAKACLSRDFDPTDAVSVLTDSSRFPDVELLPHADGALSEAAREKIIQGFRPYLERVVAGPEPGQTLVDHHCAVLKDFDRFRVLCAHRRGPLGVAGVNQETVRLLEAGVRGFRPRGAFWSGRPVIVRRNDYVAGRFNGDIGVVVKDVDGELTVAFPGEGGGIQYLAPSRLPEHQMVFAMTIHKSQGSEFSHAMVVLPSRSSPILTRELIYTGVTRAKDRMTLLGDAELLGEALSKTVQRASGLRAELWGDDA
jgi:exodeoxyribonuclease V alpha subunit